MKIRIANGEYVVYGKSTDATKPTPNVSDKEFDDVSAFFFIEQDTGDVYYYDYEAATPEWKKFGGE